MKHVSDNEVRAAHARYYGDGRAGEKMDAVASQYGVHRTTLSKMFDRLGLPRRPWRGTRLPLSAGELAAAQRAARAGASLEELAERYGMSVPTMRARLREAGFETDWRRRRAEEAP